MKTKYLFHCLMFILFPCSLLFGQGGVSSSSMGVARSGAGYLNEFGNYVMPTADYFRVEEFINYHRHDLPLPQGQNRVRLDVQAMKLDSGKSVLQVGLTTPRALESDQIPPLNVVLIIDESGSMGGVKIKNLKRSLRGFVERFRKNDRVTIVGFENRARVILPATEKTKVHKILAAIEDVKAAGGTNLHAGLMLGYKKALECFDPERTNRVIFLTDGNANVGVTQSQEIAAHSLKCIQKGISLVTIGLGVDFNHGLLREIADAGRGVMHFISDAKDIEKTFVKEVDSLLAPAARNVQLTINVEGKMKVYGYKSHREQTNSNKLVLKLDDLNHGATQVVIGKMESNDLDGVIKLQYIDAINGQKIKQKVELSDVQFTSSESIRRNYSIAIVANSLNAAARLSNNQKQEKAARKLKSAVEKANELFGGKDKHLKRVAKIARNYATKLLPERKIVRNEPKQ